MEDKKPKAKPKRRRSKSPLELTGDELLRQAERYILECSGAGEIDESPESGGPGPDKPAGRRGRREGDRGRFPNIAGFCRYLGIGTEKYASLSALYRDETGQISAAFEDEALNSGIPPTLLSAYLKLRLGYESPQAKKESAPEGELRVVFEHDILADGE